MKVAVMSDGGWGTALSLVLVANKHDVVLWGPFPDYVETMREMRVNSRFLDRVPLPEELTLTADIAEAVTGAELVVLAAPTQYARACITAIAEVGLGDDQVVVNVAKGIEVDSLKRLSEICAELIPGTPYAVLSGPSHAEEVARGVPTAVVVAGDEGPAERVQDAFMNSHFRVYTSDDVVGVELGGALKNVLAIAAGICDGMGLGDNAKAALMTRGIAEMARLGQALGGCPETFAGLSGIGDIIVTCTSGHSRNRHVGEELGRGRTLDEIIHAMGMVVAEGVKTTESAFQLSQRAKVETPIVSEVHAALYEGKDPRQALRDLMGRRARRERG